MEVDRCSTIDGLEGQHRSPELDATTRSQWKSQRRGGHMGEFGKIVNKAHCSILDTLQWFSRRCWESSQEGVAVVQAGDDQSLDQELRCIFCEDRRDPADVVEGKSAGSGHSSDVVVPKLLNVDEGHTMKS